MEEALRPVSAHAHPGRFDGLRPAAWAVYLWAAGPILAGLAGTILPAFHYLPALGGTSADFTAWKQLWAEPGIVTGLYLTLVSGLGGTAISVLLAFAILAALSQGRILHWLERFLPAWLSLPHAALAIGLSFLIAPSGLIARAFSPWLTGWELPPDYGWPRDPNGISLMIGLVLKETPFLLMMGIAALTQFPARRQWIIARSLGYPAMAAWYRSVLPRLYPLLRLPIYAVLAYSLSVVDMALILAPNTPPPFAVQIIRWANDPDLSYRFVAAAGACAQLILVALSIGLWRATEIVILTVARRRWRLGGRPSARMDHLNRQGALGLLFLLMIVTLIVTAGLALWSFAGSWNFPDFLPMDWQTRAWVKAWPGLQAPLWDTLLIGVIVTVIATGLVLGFLEYLDRKHRGFGRFTVSVLSLPLIIPQIAFLFGMQIMLSLFNLDGYLISVLALHLVFVLPYGLLVMTETYRHFDRRYLHTARSLGAGVNRSFWHVRLPMLRGPVLACLSVGFAVSVAQYLPTLFAGAGRIATITTEAVSLSSGFDRRVTAVYGLCQALLPLLAYGLAAWLTPRPDRPR